MRGTIQSFKHPQTVTLLFCLAPFLMACETVSSSRMYLSSKPLNEQESTRKAAFSAALTPLEDLGLRKREIPDMLKMLSENPYTPPQTLHCDEIKKEMADLNVLLGADIDTPKVSLSDEDEMLETGTNLLHDAVVNVVRSQTDVIPFRSIVRRLTGANKHEKAVEKAVYAGKLRRAYLRGLADARFGDACIAKVKVITATAEEKKSFWPIEIATK